MENIPSANTTTEPNWRELRWERRAIVVVDVVESVRLMQANEADFIDRWRRFVNEVRTQVLPASGGRLVKSLGDGLLLEFEKVSSAVSAALLVHKRVELLNVDQSPDRKLSLRVGVHVADIVADELDVYGAAVNLTARLAGLADADEIVASIEIVDQIVPGLDAEVDDLGDCYLKHLPEPVRAYRLSAVRRDSTRVASTPSGSHEGLGVELPRPKIGVLTLDGEAENRVLCSMVADEIALQLSAHSSLRVISRMSTRRAVDAAPFELSRRLGADYMLCGSCSIVGGRVHLILELVFAVDERVVWSDSTTARLDQLIADPAAVVSDVCRGAMAAVEAHETGRAKSLPLASLDSYSLLIGGVRLMHRLSRADFERAREVLEALVTRHPRHPDGYAWLAKWHILQVHQGWSADATKSAGMGRDMARRALDRDQQCGVAMVVAGMVKTFNDRDLSSAEGIYRDALAVHPNEALAWLLKGMVHAFRGEGELAVSHARRASELSPLDPMRYYYDSLAASAEASAGNYEQAIVLARRSLSANAMHASTLRILTIAHAMLEQMSEARQIVQRLMALEPDFSVPKFLARSPSADFPIGRVFADALARAGVPH